MREHLTGQFTPGTSILHRLDARAKFFGFLILIAATVCTDAWLGYALLLAVTAAIVAVCGLPLRTALASVARMGWFFLLIFVMNALFFATDDAIWHWWILTLSVPGIAQGAQKVVLMLSYPSDEVGNGLVDWDKLDEAGVDPYSDVLTLEQFRKKFGAAVHPFTGVDYIDFYSGIITDAGAEVEVIFGNRVQTLCDYTDAVITCDIHTRARSKRLLKAAGARVVLGLDDLLNRSVDGSGYNAEYGLLGSNKATEETVKLFPRDCMAVAEELGERLSKASGKHIEAMVYGDGAFKDPVGKIWELADPVVSPGYTKGLVGTPNELKLKYLADNDFGDLKGEALKEAIEERIREKTSESLVGNMVSEGTTPRRLTDLIGSLCDLTSGSGDKGTPIVYIQGYFDNYSND